MRGCFGKKGKFVNSPANFTKILNILIVFVFLIIMPLRRKVVTVGDSKAVTIPHDFIQSWRDRGKTFSEVYITINDKMIVKPILVKINAKKKN